MPNLKQRLTEPQANRLIDLAAGGPLTIKQPIDGELDALGWTERYDGMYDATELRVGMTQYLYQANGAIQEWLMPEEWQRWQAKYKVERDAREAFSAVEDETAR